ncbi:hypothetical protein [Acidovorax sp.]|uniref:hypothetical protein n=1 Tax=Acidovorax sp. TaxID=1872122 RepID=UPI0025C5BE57|nr:hypothetical protein [Acidovorax sp.]
MTTPMHLTHCTLTGVDEKTALHELIDLSVDHPIAEWGFLYSPKRQGQPGRYPSIAMLGKSFSDLPANVRVALHVCGQGVPDLLAGESKVSRLVAMVGERGGRVQLNFNQTREPIDLDALRDFLKANHALQVITQHNDANSHVWPALQGAGNHAVLFDSSGGRGILAGQWQQALNGVPCGYAGGLGCNNLDEQLEAIAAAAGSASTWIDMEGSLRRMDADGHDWFSLEHCTDCLAIASERISRHVEVSAEDGWWVSSDQWFSQKVSPLTGSWQQVRCFNGIVVNACRLYGRDGWWDGNYKPVDGVTEWFKPKRWFNAADDIEGDVAAVQAYKASLSKSPLRGVVHG